MVAGPGFASLARGRIWSASIDQTRTAKMVGTARVLVSLVVVALVVGRQAGGRCPKNGRPTSGPPPPRREPRGTFTAEDAASCSPEETNTGYAGACVEQGMSDLLYNRPIPHEAICDPVTGKQWCCKVAVRNNRILGCYSE